MHDENCVSRTLWESQLSENERVRKIAVRYKLEAVVWKEIATTPELTEIVREFTVLVPKIRKPIVFFLIDPTCSYIGFDEMFGDWLENGHGCAVLAYSNNTAYKEQVEATRTAFCQEQ